MMYAKDASSRLLKWQKKATVPDTQTETSTVIIAQKQKQLQLLLPKSKSRQILEKLSINLPAWHSVTSKVDKWRRNGQ